MKELAKYLIPKVFLSEMVSFFIGQLLSGVDRINTCLMTKNKLHLNKFLRTPNQMPHFSSLDYHEND